MRIRWNFRLKGADYISKWGGIAVLWKTTFLSASKFKKLVNLEPSRNPTLRHNFLPQMSFLDWFAPIFNNFVRKQFRHFWLRKKIGHRLAAAEPEPMKLAVFNATHNCSYSDAWAALTTSLISWNSSSRRCSSGREYFDLRIYALRRCQKVNLKWECQRLQLMQLQLRFRSINKQTILPTWGINRGRRDEVMREIEARYIPEMPQCNYGAQEGKDCACIPCLCLCRE